MDPPARVQFPVAAPSTLFGGQHRYFLSVVDGAAT